MIKKILFTISFLSIFIFNTLGQQGAIKGIVKDASGEPVPIANISILNGDKLITGGSSDFDGKFNISPIPPGTYTIKVTHLSFDKPYTVKRKVGAGETVFLRDIKLGGGEFGDATVLGGTTITAPLISNDSKKVTKFDSKKIGNMAVTNITDVAAYAPGVSQSGSWGGNRPGSQQIFVNGVASYSTNINPDMVESVEVITGGVPAKYGDLTGGYMSITTKTVLSENIASIDATTSQFLDPSGYNLIRATFGGPLLFRDTAANKFSFNKYKKSEGEKTKNKDKKAVAGYMIGGSLNYIKDPVRAHGGGYWVAKDDVKDYVINNPVIRQSAGNDARELSSLFLQDGSFEKVKARENADAISATLTPILGFHLRKNMKLTFKGAFTYNNQKGNSRANYMFNSDNFSRSISKSWQTSLSFTHILSSTYKKDTTKKFQLFNNTYYVINASYQEALSKSFNNNHEDNLFDYGYIGKFKTDVKKAYTSSKGPIEELGGLVAYKHSGYSYNLTSDFVPSDLNPELTKFTTSYFDLFDDDYYGGAYRTVDDLINPRALLNGDSPDGIYKVGNNFLWTTPGTQPNGNSKSKSSRIDFNFSLRNNIGDHSIETGFIFEKRTSRSWGVAPIGLWTRARQLMNSHINSLEETAYLVFDNGVFTYENADQGNVFLDTVYYERGYNAESQTEFDKNFRTSLGKAIDGTEWVDINNYDPSYFKLEYFSPDELINDGNSYVSYSGYDIYGDKLKHRPTLNDFFTDRFDNGRYKREIAAYEPIYSAFYIQDEFTLNDINFNIGLRIDRFDANQMVLKDEFSLYDTYKAGEVSEIGGEAVSHPSNIGNDFVVYVDDVDNPSKINGYRKDREWYDNAGNQITDPSLIYASGSPAPYIKEPELRNTSQKLSVDAFEDYEPQIVVMPRIAFRFPIGDEAAFFANYDILSQRSTGALNPFDYYFIQKRGWDGISNPNLKPKKTINYEIGFQRTLDDKSVITISSFYKEIRDEIAPISYVGAYPTDYISFGNIDFGTVKGFSLVYELRNRTRSGMRVSNVSMQVSYTLQFANGTGSSAGDNYGLISKLAKTGSPDLRVMRYFNYDQRHNFSGTVDYRFASGKGYFGPGKGGTGEKILRNMGANLTLRVASGSPYTKTSIDGTYLGSINGSRMPWYTNFNLKISKQLKIGTAGKKEDNGEKKAKKKGMPMIVYLDVRNLLNFKNVVSVYSVTGNADDNGYLTAPEKQDEIAAKTDEEAFRNYYTMNVENPFNYSAPRTIRLGAVLRF